MQGQPRLQGWLQNSTFKHVFETYVYAK